jgi:uncharacterized protein YaaW (UPF0174 family)
MKKIDLARNDQDLYPLLLKANDQEKAVIAEVIASKNSADIDKEERDPLKLTLELQSMGGDSVMNLLRGHGVNYREIVADVADKVGLKIETESDLIDIEEKIAEKVISEYMAKLSESERIAFEKVLQGSLEDQKMFSAATRSMVGVTPALMAISTFVLQRGGLMAIPGVGQFFGVLTGVAGVLFAFTGTAYSVTIPAVLFVGSIRSRLLAEETAVSP